MTQKQLRKEIIEGFRQIAFPAEAESVDIRERLKAMENLAKLAGLFDKPEEEARPENIAVRFLGMDGEEA